MMTVRRKEGGVYNMFAWLFSIWAGYKVSEWICGPWVPQGERYPPGTPAGRAQEDEDIVEVLDAGDDKPAINPIYSRDYTTADRE